MENRRHPSRPRVANPGLSVGFGAAYRREVRPATIPSVLSLHLSARNGYAGTPVCCGYPSSTDRRGDEIPTDEPSL
jgi:hypothetical protein